MNGGLIGLNETKHHMKHHLRHHILFFTNGVMNILIYVTYTTGNYYPLNSLGKFSIVTGLQGSMVRHAVPHLL